MWILLAITSAICLGFYDVMKKLSVAGNNVPVVLMLNTLFQTLLMSPILVGDFIDGSCGPGQGGMGHLLILLKSFIVLSSWMAGYFAIKHLPLTIQGPINATRPVIVLVGALLIFGEHLNLLQWCGVLLGFASLFFISRIGAKEGHSVSHDKFIWLAILATLLGAISALYDKWLMQSFEPLQVQAWYSLYQFAMMSIVVLILTRTGKSDSSDSSDDSDSSASTFRWRWSIVGISVFLTIADVAYFYSLSIPGAMISIISMIRRGSVLVSFAYGVLILHERHVRQKLIDLGILLLSLTLLVLGS